MRRIFCDAGADSATLVGQVHALLSSALGSIFRRAYALRASYLDHPSEFGLCVTQSHVVVCYLLGMHLLNVLLGLITPAGGDEGPTLPTHSEEFRPFERKLPEMLAWRSGMSALLFSLFATLTEATDLPAYYPLLLVYFLMLTFVTLRARIQHMLHFRYLPWSVGKQTYGDIKRRRKV